MNVIEEGNKIAQNVSYTNYCRLLERISATDTASSKRDMLSRFIVFWAQQYANLASASIAVSAGRGSFYPVLRLLLPQCDHSRPAYGLGAHSLARLYIKLLGIAPNGPAAKQLMQITDGENSFQSCRGRCDFAELIYSAVRERCLPGNSLTLKQTNDLLDQLAWATSNAGRLVALTSLIQSATAIEHKWIARLVVRRDSGCGMTVDSVLQCLHPSAPSLWNVTQDLKIFCQRLADLPLPGAMTTEMGPSKGSAVTEASITLCVPFKPMLCERANNPKELCAAVLKLPSPPDDHLQLLLETKYDGERIQVHKNGSDYRYWSRNCLEWTASYGASAGDNTRTSCLTPYLHTAFSSKVRECIIDGEMMIYNTLTECILPKTSGFDVKRSSGGERWKQTACLGPASEKDDDTVDSCYQPCLLAFDLLYLNGEVLTQYPLVKRKHLLAELFGQLPSVNSTSLASSSSAAGVEETSLVPQPVLPGRVYLSGWCQAPPDEAILSTVFNQLMDSRQEGMVVKVISAGHRTSTYQPGRRNGGGWWKLKPDYVAGLLEDIDCLVVGGYSVGRLSQSLRIRQFLCAVRGPDLAIPGSGSSTQTLPRFLSFCRVSSGLTIAELKYLNRRLQPHWVPYDRKKPNCRPTEWLQVKTERPDFWIHPQNSVTFELHAAELIPTTSYAAGLTCRFPRVMAVRYDKPWTDCITLPELQHLNTSTSGKLAIRRIDLTDGGAVVNRDPVEEEEDSSGLGDSVSVCQSSASVCEDTAPPLLCSPTLDPGGDLSNRTRADKRSVPSHFRPVMTSTPRKQSKAGPEASGSTFGFTSTPQTPGTSSTDTFLAGHEFCIILSADRTVDKKVSLESQILRAGGTVVQNPTARTFCLVVDKLTVKTKNLVKFSKSSKRLKAPDGYDIVHIDWLHDCLTVKRLLPWRPMDLLVTSSRTAAELANQYDRYGDHYTRAIEPSQLHKLFDEMTDDSEGLPCDGERSKCSYAPITSAAVDNLISAEFSDDYFLSVWKPLRKCSIIILRFHLGSENSGHCQLPGMNSGDLGQAPAYARVSDDLKDRLLTVDLRRLGAWVVHRTAESEHHCGSLLADLPSLASRLSHVVLVGMFSISSLTSQLLSSYLPGQESLHVVTENWALDCIARGCRCEEQSYYNPKLQ